MAKQGPVLVVDDEPDVAGLMVALLESEGYRTVLATSGKEALEFVERERPAAVVLDLSLPDVDGVQVLHLLKEGESAAIPVIVVSAFTGRLNGADKALLHAVFEKPFDLDDLSAAVKRVCRRRTKPVVGIPSMPPVAAPPAISVA